MTRNTNIIQLNIYGTETSLIRVPSSVRGEIITVVNFLKNLEEAAHLSLQRIEIETIPHLYVLTFIYTRMDKCIATRSAARSANVFISSNCSYYYVDDN